MEVKNFFFWISLVLLVTYKVTGDCPNYCICKTNENGLHSATCSNLKELYKFSVKEKHHNMNILVLSHNNITKLNWELDNFNEIVSLDLSNNGITEVGKFLHHAKKLVHLSLAYNRINEISFQNLPLELSSLDLRNNLITDFTHGIEGLLTKLEHLQLEGNPLNCSCNTMLFRDSLLSRKVLFDDVICNSPAENSGIYWSKLNTKEICKTHVPEIYYLDMMMGDEPINISKVIEEADSLKAESEDSLNTGVLIKENRLNEGDDSLEFIKIKDKSVTVKSENFEGSGDFDTTTLSTIYDENKNSKLNSKITENKEIFPTTNDTMNENSDEGSGEGSGFGIIFPDIPDVTSSSTLVYEELNPEPVHRFFDEDNETITEFPIPKPPTVYAGGPYWHLEQAQPESTSPVSNKIVTTTTPETIKYTTISEQIMVTHVSEVLEQTLNSTDNKTKRTGTYVCIAIMIVLLVGMIAVTITKSQIRKRRENRITRQQKRDVEKAAKEMVDMNKSLLGKPAILDGPIDKKLNGNYELVPTHDSLQKKGTNGDINNGKIYEYNDLNKDYAKNSKGSSVKETAFVSNGIVDKKPDTENRMSKNDTDNLSTEEVFPPLNDYDPSQPLMNGSQNNDTGFISPSREYIPVYTPDTGRVKIRMTETPKPKTPVLVTRSRSNAGDIVVTPLSNADNQENKEQLKQ